MTNLLEHLLGCWTLLVLLSSFQLTTGNVILNALNANDNATKSPPDNDTASSPAVTPVEGPAVEIVDDFGAKLSCFVNSVDQYKHNLVNTMVKIDKATLLEYVFTIRNYSENPLTTNMTKSYHANKWSRVTTSHGQTLLSLAFNYGILSMMTLRFGTTALDVELYDNPPGCMGDATEEQKIASVRHLLMRDFMKGGNISLIEEERVCHEVVKGVSGYAYFKDRCYSRDIVTKKPTIEDDVDTNFWLSLLYTLLVIIKFGLLLFGPVLFISAIESMSQDNIPYVVKLKDHLTKTICIAQKGTQLLSNCTYRRVIDLRNRKGFTKLKEIASQIPAGRPTKVKFDQYDITVDYKRMLTENIVDVGLCSSLFRAILKCKIRDVGPFQTCCKSDMLAGCKSCGVKKPLPWIRCLRKVANLLLIVLIPTPYYIRLLVFYIWEYDEIMARKDLIKLNGLTERYENSLIHYFTPTHPLFLVIYMIYAMTAFMLAFMSRKQNEGRILKIIVGSFRDLRTLNWTETLSMVVANLLWPLKRFGLLGFLVGLLYWPIAIPFTIVIGLVYALPTVYLSIRMAFYSKSAIFERGRRKKKNKPYQVNTKSDLDMHKFEASELLEKTIVRPESPTKDNDDDLGLDDIDQIAPDEHFKNLKDNISLASSIIKYQTTNWRRFITYVLSAIICIATLFACVIILSEVIGVLVEVIVFTIMGIIVNANALLKYVMLILMIFIYSCDCFNNMEKKYLKLNKALFGEVKGRLKDLSEVTSMPAHLQENRGFKSQELCEQAEYETPDDIASKPLNHWMINDLVLFIDSQDMPRIPKQLFDDVCNIRVAGVPGPVFRGLLEAFESFLKAVLFVLFVFIIVLTFGAVYKVSSTGQMLATLVGGFLPMMLKTFLAPPTPDVEIGTVSFKSKMDEVIKNFCQKWPIYDLPFKLITDEDLKKEEDKKKDGDKKDDKEKDGKKEDEKKAADDKKNEQAKMIPVSPTRAPSSPSYKEPQSLDFISSYGHYDPDGTFAPAYMSNNNPDPVLEYLFTDEVDGSPAAGPVKKCVRVMENLGENEVDILIYLPDKYDDVWLDEWSDIVSRNSKQQEELTNV